MKPFDTEFNDFLATGSGSASIPVKRIIDKMNQYMSRLDYQGAERHLNYWLQEAEMLGDRRGALTVLNELIGHDRKTSQEEAFHRHSTQALRLLYQLKITDGVTAGTTYINIGTAEYVFRHYERSIDMFTKALDAFQHSREVSADLMGGLHNNMGLTLTALKRYDEAINAYETALSWMSRQNGTEPEQAETLLNMANTLEYQYGMEQAEGRIYTLLDRAEQLLDASVKEHDGYYHYILLHCIPTFEHYGYFAAAERFRSLTERYYEGS